MIKYECPSCGCEYYIKLPEGNQMKCEECGQVFDFESGVFG